MGFMHPLPWHETAARFQRSHRLTKLDRIRLAYTALALDLEAIWPKGQ